MPRLRLTTTALVLLNGGLITICVFAWFSGQRRIHEPDYVAARALAMPDISVLNPATAPALDVAGIRDNAVFHSHRSFYRPPLPSESIPIPDYTLAGTMGLPQGKRVAFVKKNSDLSNREIHVGDDLDGWRVEAIDAAQVIVVRAEQRYELQAKTPGPVSGLLHGDVSAAPKVMKPGLHTLGGDESVSMHAHHERSIAARIYQPPPAR